MLAGRWGVRMHRCGAYLLSRVERMILPQQIYDLPRLPHACGGLLATPPCKTTKLTPK